MEITDILRAWASRMWQGVLPEQGGLWGQSVRILISVTPEIAAAWARDAQPTKIRFNAEVAVSLPPSSRQNLTGHESRPWLVSYPSTQRLPSLGRTSPNEEVLADLIWLICFACGCVSRRFFGGTRRVGSPGYSVYRIVGTSAILTAEGLRAEFAKVLEFIPLEGRFLVRAGGAGTRGRRICNGWSRRSFANGLCAAHRQGGDFQSSRKRRTLPEPRAFIEHGIRRAMNVILQGDGEPYGVLWKSIAARRRVLSERHYVSARRS